MKYLILSGGSAPGQRLLKSHIRNADIVIGVDGAADVFYKYGIVPHVLIGDFDTADAMCVNHLEENGAKVIRLKQEKNETDTEAAVGYALESGADDIVILGATGRRMDHTLSNIMMLVRADKAGVRCRIIDRYNELMVSDRAFCLAGAIGQTISILPLTGELCVSATNLKYPLDNLELTFGSSRGISNIMLKSESVISITGGYALIVKNFLNS
ncbi:MAG: thiamine diphosphokinase [Eubacteriales bacterium]|nr:thiamine diphosphokinase [Eubacteriales bacterium]